MKAVTLFTRQGCCLCDEAHEVLERVRARLPFALAVVDLDREASSEQRDAYTEELPVVEIEGRKAFKFRVEEARLVRLLG